MNQIWQDHEKEYIRQHAATMKDREIAAKLNELGSRPITLQAVRKQRQKMGIVKAPGRGKCELQDKRNIPNRQMAKNEARQNEIGLSDIVNEIVSAVG